MPLSYKKNLTPTTSVVILTKENTTDVVSLADFNKLPFSERELKTQKVIDYVCTIPGISKDILGVNIGYVTKAQLIQAMINMYQKVSLIDSSEDIKPRILTDICCDWINVLQYHLSELQDDISTHPNSSADKAIVMALQQSQVLVERLVEKWKSLHSVLSLDRLEIMKMLREDSGALRRIGSGLLADFAYKQDDDNSSLYEQLRVYDYIFSLSEFISSDLSEQDQRIASSCLNYLSERLNSNVAWAQTLTEVDRYKENFERKKLVSQLKDCAESKKMIKRLEEILGANSAQKNKTKLEIAQEFKHLIDNSSFQTKMQGGGALEDSLSTLLEGIISKEQAQIELLTIIDQLPEFKNFNKKEVWRLVVDYYQQENRGEYGFENESGYTAAMLTALGNMLRDKNKKLDANSLLQLHDMAVEGVLQMNRKRSDYNKLSELFQQAQKDQYFITTGYRNNIKNGFGLVVDNVNIIKGGHNTTMAGFQELLEKSKADSGQYFFLDYRKDAAGVPIPNEYGKIGELWTMPQTAEEGKMRAQAIIDAYHAELVTAGASVDAKLIAIARLCRDLEVSHLFKDGNARTIGMLVINKELLRNDLEPVILTNPNVFDGFSVQELAEEIKVGQTNFKKFYVGS